MSLTWADLFEEQDDQILEYGNEDDINKDLAKNQEENKQKFKKQSIEFMNYFMKTKHLQENL